jgi:hypothetical protein
MKSSVRTIRILIVSLLTTFLLYGFYSFFIASAEYPFEYPNAGYFIVKMKYHEAMNDYFNKKIKLFLGMKSDDKDYFPPKEGEECGEKNVSTYCVAMGALDTFMAYSATLDKVPALALQNSLSGKGVQVPTAPVIGNPAKTIADVFSAVITTDQDIATEKKNALNIMEATISSYNEFRLAYPMHKKYEEIINELFNYRDSIRMIRLQIQRLPAKFKDVTSQSCQ